MNPSLRIEIEFRHPRTIAVLQRAHARCVEDGVFSPSSTIDHFVKDLVCDAIDGIERSNATAVLRDDDVIAIAPGFDTAMDLAFGG